MPEDFAIDISYAQGYPNFDRLALNIPLVIAKAASAEGGSLYRDSKLENNRTQVRRIGRQFGTYFFNGPVSPRACAEYYFQAIDYHEGDFTALDIESPNAWGPGQALEFMDRFKQLSGVVPASYGSTSLLLQDQWKQVSDFGSPLWAANYGSNNGQPGRDPGKGKWARRVLWQFTSTAQHSGLSGSVDTNRIDQPAFSEYIGTTPATAKPTEILRRSTMSNVPQVFTHVTTEGAKPRTSGARITNIARYAIVDGTLVMFTRPNGGSEVDAKNTLLLDPATPSIDTLVLENDQIESIKWLLAEAKRLSA